MLVFEYRIYATGSWELSGPPGKCRNIVGGTCGFCGCNATCRCFRRGDLLDTSNPRYQGPLGIGRVAAAIVERPTAGDSDKANHVGDSEKAGRFTESLFWHGR
jgi:hypothetical protein